MFTYTCLYYHFVHILTFTYDMTTTVIVWMYSRRRMTAHSSGTLYLAGFTSPRDTHIQSIDTRGRVATRSLSVHNDAHAPACTCIASLCAPCNRLHQVQANCFKTSNKTVQSHRPQAGTLPTLPVTYCKTTVCHWSSPICQQTAARICKD